MSRINECILAINFLRQKYIYRPLFTRGKLPYLNRMVITVACVLTLYKSLVNFLIIEINYHGLWTKVVSAKSKSSTSTMVYVAGIFQFAPATKLISSTNFYQYQPHEKSRDQQFSY